MYLPVSKGVKTDFQEERTAILSINLNPSGKEGNKGFFKQLRKERSALSYARWMFC